MYIIKCKQIGFLSALEDYSIAISNNGRNTEIKTRAANCKKNSIAMNINI